MTPDADEDAAKAGHSHTAGGNVKWHSHSGDTGNFFKKLNATTAQPGNRVPGRLAQRSERLWFTQKLVHKFSQHLYS